MATAEETREMPNLAATQEAQTPNTTNILTEICEGINFLQSNMADLRAEIINLRTEVTRLTDRLDTR